MVTDDDSEPRPPPPSSRAEDGWSVDLDERYAAVVTDGERVCSTEDFELFCLDADTGETWFRTELPGFGRMPSLSGETLVVAADGGAGGGDVFGYSMDGDLLWESTRRIDGRQLRETMQPFPVVGTTVLVEDGVALDAESGAPLWELDTFFPFDSGVELTFDDLASDGYRFYGSASWTAEATPSTRGGIVALDPATGTELWRFDAGLPYVHLSSVTSPDGGAGVVVTLGGQLSEAIYLDAATGAVRWRVPTTESSGAAAHIGGITVVADSVAVRGYDAAGTVLWETPESYASLVVADDGIYALGTGLSAIDPATGTTDHFPGVVSPTSVVATDRYLVVAGKGWRALPLPLA